MVRFFTLNKTTLENCFSLFKVVAMIEGRKGRQGRQCTFIAINKEKLQTEYNRGMGVGAINNNFILC